MTQYSLYNDEPVIRTLSGRFINIFDPHPDDILIEDIAHSLSFECRWGNHIPIFHSVAAHSINCCKIAPDNLKFDTLMHDCFEAYGRDLPKPIKDKFKEYSIIENKFMEIAANKFGFKWPMSNEIKEIDKLMLEAEWLWLHMTKKPKKTYPLYVKKAKKEFLRLFKELSR